MKAWYTFSTIALIWAVGLTIVYLGFAVKGEGPGDMGSWLGVLAIVWGPLAALHAGRSWLEWYHTPESDAADLVTARSSSPADRSSASKQASQPKMTEIANDVAQISPPPFCSACGAKLASDSRFCDRCGVQVPWT